MDDLAARRRTLPGRLTPRVGPAASAACLLVLFADCAAPTVAPPGPAPEAEASVARQSDGGSALSSVSYYTLARHPDAAEWMIGADEHAPPAVEPDERLSLPAGMQATYDFEVPAGARLLADVELSGHATLEVELLEDGVEPERWSTAWPDARALDLDLTGRAGHYVALRFSARGGSVQLGHPRVTRTVATQRTLARSRRNVVIFLVDTLRADHLDFYDTTAHAQIPALADWARGAVVFEHAYAPANWTKPNVATVLTGLQPWQHGATTHLARLPDHITMLSQMLQERGYFTGAMVANGYITSTFDFERGWDTWRNQVHGPVDSAHFATQLPRWLARRPRDRPFFLYVHTTDSHAPYRAGGRDVHRLDPEAYAGPANFRRRPQLLNEVRSGTTVLTPRDRQRLVALYDASIEGFDRSFGRMLAALKRDDPEGQTLVVFLADHGEEFLDHGSVGHGRTLWNELVQIPMVVGIAGAEGMRVSDVVGSADVVPTLFDALGETPPPGLPGHSMLPLIEGASLDAPPLAVGSVREWSAIELGRLKLHLRGPSAHPTAELYDLQDDPAETHDLASARPLAVRYMSRALLRRLRDEPAPLAPDANIAPEFEAQLRALGYVGTQRAN